MTTQIGTTTQPGIRRPTRKQLAAVACGITIAIAGFSGAGILHATRQASPTSAGVHPAAVTRTGNPSAGQLSQSFTDYMVGSQEQASQVENEFREGASALANGEPALPKYEIVVVSTAEDEELLRQVVRDMTADANAAGMLSTQLIDLRPR